MLGENFPSECHSVTHCHHSNKQNSIKCAIFSYKKWYHDTQKKAIEPARAAGFFFSFRKERQISGVFMLFTFNIYSECKVFVPLLGGIEHAKG